MDKPFHPQGTQEILLHASYPPTHPDRLCDWTVTSVTGELLDSACMLLVFALVFNNQMLPGICLSLAYVTWVASLSRLHWRHTATAGRLPNYKAFLASLRPMDDTTRKQNPVGEEQDDRNCMVCWSSDDVPLELPCKRNHLICSDCLARLHESHRYQCPICRLPLYTMLNIKTKLLELIIATLGAIFALTVIDIALAIYKGSYQDVAMVILFTALPTLIEVRYFEFSSAASEGYLASWQAWTLASHAFNLAVFACRSGDFLRRRDQATFIRGKFVSGVEMSTALTFSRGA
jgi:hypothetical protein